jgi:imidazolonepropionase-like amidohydrolase
MRTLAAALAALAPLLVPPPAAARPDPPTAHALVGARVVVAPGRVLPKATVVLRDGLVAGVGEALQPPADARIWPLEGKTIYPGLIDAWVPRPWPLAKAAELPQGAHSNPLVRAERDVVDRLRDEAAWKALREAGFTTALVVPGDGIFRGRGAVANLADDPSAGLLRAGAVQAVSVRPPDDFEGYPGSLMGAVALFRQTVLDARWHRQAQAAHRADPAQARPAWNASLAALEPAAAGEMPIVFETKDVADTLRVLGLAEELDLRGWVVGSGEEYQRIDEVRARPLPLVLPLAFPERPDVRDLDDGTLGLDALRHWDQAPANPALVDQAKLPFALTSFRQKQPKDLWKALARAIGRGLDRDRALAALTRVPAELLGISGRAGSVEVGKMANLVVVDGDLLVESPKIVEVWIDGVRYATADDEKKKDGDDEKEPATSRAATEVSR